MAYDNLTTNVLTKEAPRRSLGDRCHIEQESVIHTAFVTYGNQIVKAHNLFPIQSPFRHELHVIRNSHPLSVFFTTSFLVSTIVLLDQTRKEQ